MGYVAESLTADEKVLYTAKFHWLYTVSAVIWIFLLGWLFGLGILIFLIIMINKWTTEIAITNKRLIYKRGWIARKTDEISLKKIEEVNFSQGVLERILGYGEVRIQGTGSGVLVLPTIDDPLVFRREIEDAKTQMVTTA